MVESEESPEKPPQLPPPAGSGDWNGPFWRRRQKIRVTSEYDSESAVFFHKISCKLVEGLAKLKLSFHNDGKGEIADPQLAFTSKFLFLLYDLQERNALLKGSFEVGSALQFSAIHDVKDDNPVEVRNPGNIEVRDGKIDYVGKADEVFEAAEGPGLDTSVEHWDDAITKVLASMDRNAKAHCVAAIKRGRHISTVRKFPVRNSAAADLDKRDPEEVNWNSVIRRRLVHAGDQAKAAILSDLNDGISFVFVGTDESDESDTQESDASENDNSTECSSPKSKEHVEQASDSEPIDLQHEREADWTPAGRCGRTGKRATNSSRGRGRRGNRGRRGR